MSELDPVNDALERLEWQEAREDAPERHPLAAISRRAALTGGAAALVSTAIAACGGDGNKPASSKAQSGTSASGDRSGASSRASCHSRRSSASLTGSSSDIVPPPRWGLGTRALESGTTRSLSPRVPLLSFTSEAVKAYCER